MFVSWLLLLLAYIGRCLLLLQLLELLLVLMCCCWRVLLFALEVVGVVDGGCCGWVLSLLVVVGC